MCVSECSLYKMFLLSLRSFNKSLVCSRPFPFSKEKPFRFCAQFWVLLRQELLQMTAPLCHSDHENFKARPV